MDSSNNTSHQETTNTKRSVPVVFNFLEDPVVLDTPKSFTSSDYDEEDEDPQPSPNVTHAAPKQILGFENPQIERSIVNSFCDILKVKAAEKKGINTHLKELYLDPTKVSHEDYLKHAQTDVTMTAFDTFSNRFQVHTGIPTTSTEYLYEGITENDFKILPETSICHPKPDVQFCGLMQYVFKCWALEKGVILRPCDVFFTIVSEIAVHIMKHDSFFRKLFGVEHDGKQEINIIAIHPHDFVKQLTSILSTYNPLKDLASLILKTNFVDAPEHYPLVMSITLAEIGTQYFSYGTTACGIPKVTVTGGLEEWQKISDTLQKMRNMFNKKSNGWNEPHHRLQSLIYDQFDIVNQIINKTYLEPDKNFFSDIFVYGRYKKCGSGHTSPVIIRGWLRKLYANHNYIDFINRYNSHLNCLPYRQLENNQLKVFVSGLTSGTFDSENNLVPHYDVVHADLIGPNAEKIFAHLSGSSERVPVDDDD